MHFKVSRFGQWSGAQDTGSEHGFSCVHYLSAVVRAVIPGLPASVYFPPLLRSGLTRLLTAPSVPAGRRAPLRTAVLAPRNLFLCGSLVSAAV